MKPVANFCNNKDMKELIEDVLFSCGIIVRREYTVDFEEDWSKTECDAEKVGPGSRVKIFWTYEWEDPDFDENLDCDIGYVLTLPGYDSEEIFTSGIVHIPKPKGCQKCECDPMWIHLGRLTSFWDVKKIVIEDKGSE